MALSDYMLWKLFANKPAGPSVNGTMAAFAIGERVFQRDGVNPHMVRAVKLSIENDRKIAAKRAIANHRV